MVRLDLDGDKPRRGRSSELAKPVSSAIGMNSLVKGKQSQDFLFTWPNDDRVLDFRVSWRKMCIVAKVSVLLHDFRREISRKTVVEAGAANKESVSS